VPADGYYEWRTEPSPDGGKPVKTPFFIHRAAAEDGTTPSLALAGLYSWWRDPARDDDDPERWVLSTTVLTQPARDGLEAIHDREPVVLPADAVDAWLDTELRWHEVGTRVGSVRNDDARLIEAV
jgi:putative SOS response-associated peptidase YedK